MRRILSILAVGLGLTIATHATAQVDPEKDLFTVITLRGLPCGKVVKHTKRADNDYDVVCSSGDRYHVFIKDDRVVVEKR
jgi:hypothetical protein